MLTADLLRVKKPKGAIEPQYLDPTDAEAMARATELCAIFARHEGGQKGELDAEVEAIIGHGTDFLVWRGLAKLLYDRATFETVSAVEPVELRRAIWEAAARTGAHDEGSRRAILEAVGDELSVSLEEVEAGMYADLDAEQRLVEFKALEPQGLLDRYNLALAQAVLYRAVSLTVTLDEPDPNRLRYLFQILKFHRLMHRARREGNAWVIEVDGPASLFSKSRKYGLQMALFLPALVLAERWKMVAVIDYDGDGKEREFELSPEAGLRSHYRARGQWVAEEERWFEERFEQLESGWELHRQGAIVDLSGGEVLVPDYRLVSPKGEEVFVEIVGFWRRGYLERRIEMLDRVEVPLVLVVAERLKTDKKALDQARAEVFFFKGVILADKVLEAAEAALTR